MVGSTGGCLQGRSLEQLLSYPTMPVVKRVSISDGFAQLAGRGPRRDGEQSVGDSRERRDDDDAPARRRRGQQVHDAADRLGVGEGRASEFVNGD